MNNLIGIAGKIDSVNNTVAEILQLLQVYNKNPNSIELNRVWKESILTTFTKIIEDKKLLEYHASSSDFKIKKFADKLKDKDRDNRAIR